MSPLFTTLKGRLAAIRIMWVPFHEAGLRRDRGRVRSLVPIRPAGEPPSPSASPCPHLWHGEHRRVNALVV